MVKVLLGSAIASILSFYGFLSMGAAWMNQPVTVPVGWLLIGALVLTFVPTLSLVAVVQRRLGVNVEIEDK